MKKRKLACFLLVLSVIVVVIGIYYSNFKYVSNKNSEKRIAKINKEIRDDKSVKNFYVLDGESQLIQLIGQKSKFGIANKTFREKVFIDTELYLWGDKDNIIGKSLRVVGKSQDGNKIQLASIRKVSKNGHIKIPGESSDISVAKEQLSLKFPKMGKWNLDIYIDNKVFGKLSVNVLPYVQNNSSAPSSDLL